MAKCLIVSVLMLVAIALASAGEEETRVVVTHPQIAQDSSAMSFLNLVKGDTQQCYQCSAPCSHGACCPGQFPQCCWVNGLGCRCCRS